MVLLIAGFVRVVPPALSPACLVLRRKTRSQGRCVGRGRMEPTCYHKLPKRNCRPIRLHAEHEQQEAGHRNMVSRLLLRLLIKFFNSVVYKSKYRFKAAWREPLAGPLVKTFCRNIFLLILRFLDNKAHLGVLPQTPQAF